VLRQRALILECPAKKEQTRRGKLPEKEYYLSFIIVFDVVVLGQVWSFVAAKLLRVVYAYPQP
jgi:hypothetical protein